MPTPTAINLLSPATNDRLQTCIDRDLGVIFPALALAVLHHGEWQLNAAWGWIDPETRQYPVTPATNFDLASVTKLFAATAFLAQVSDGLVKLDDSLVKVVPEFGAGGRRPLDGGQDPHSKIQLPTPEAVRDQLADPRQVTFWHLLTHTSGLAPWRDVFRVAGPPPSPPDTPDPVSRAERWNRALAALCQYPFVGQSDHVVRYSDLGLMLLGEAIARLDGQPGQLEVVIQERVLQPLGLESLTYNPIHNGRDRYTIAPTENDPIWRQRRCWGEVHDENACGVGGVAGHAGLFGTAAEVARFGQFWLEADPRLRITAELIAESKREHAETDGMRRGLGWMLKATQDSSAGDRFSLATYGHTGFTGTSLWIDPQRELVVACFTNRVYPGREVEGIHAFRRAVHDLLAEESLNRQDAKTPRNAGSSQ